MRGKIGIHIYIYIDEQVIHTHACTYIGIHACIHVRALHIEPPNPHGARLVFANEALTAAADRHVRHPHSRRLGHVALSYHGVPSLFPHLYSLLCSPFGPSELEQEAVARDDGYRYADEGYAYTEGKAEISAE